MLLVFGCGITSLSPPPLRLQVLLDLVSGTLGLAGGLVDLALGLALELLGLAGGLTAELFRLAGGLALLDIGAGLLDFAGDGGWGGWSDACAR